MSHLQAWCALLVRVHRPGGELSLIWWGLSATLSHTAVVWVVAMAGLNFGSDWVGYSVEAYLQIVSAIIVMAAAIWMIWRTRRNEHACFHDHGGHSGHHAQEHRKAKLIVAGHDIREEGAKSRFNISLQGHRHHARAAHQIGLEIERAYSKSECFTFAQRDGVLVSHQTVSALHEFMVRLTLTHGLHSHEC